MFFRVEQISLLSDQVYLFFLVGGNPFLFFGTRDQI